MTPETQLVGRILPNKELKKRFTRLTQFVYLETVNVINSDVCLCFNFSSADLEFIGTYHVCLFYWAYL